MPPVPRVHQAEMAGMQAGARAEGRDVLWAEAPPEVLAPVRGVGLADGSADGSTASLAEMPAGAPAGELAGSARPHQNLSRKKPAERKAALFLVPGRARV